MLLLRVPCFVLFVAMPRLCCFLRVTALFSGSFALSRRVCIESPRYPPLNNSARTQERPSVRHRAHDVGLRRVARVPGVCVAVRNEIVMFRRYPEATKVWKGIHAETTVSLSSGLL